MATLKVVTPFTVQLDPTLPPEPGAEPKGGRTAETRDPNAPTRYVFPTPGVYEDVPEEVATHPYTLPHLEGYEPPEQPPLEVMTGTVVMVPVPEPSPTSEERRPSA